jgi:hypothetical protein
MDVDAAAQSDLSLARDQDVQHRIVAAVPLDKTWFGAPFFSQCLSVLGFVLLQSPWYMLKWLVSLLQLPALLWRGRTPTDQDVVDLVEGSGICMLLSKVQDGTQAGETFKFSFQHCQLVCAGKQLQSLSIVYTKSFYGNDTTR